MSEDEPFYIKRWGSLVDANQDPQAPDEHDQNLRSNKNYDPINPCFGFCTGFLESILWTKH